MKKSICTSFFLTILCLPVTSNAVTYFYESQDGFVFDSTTNNSKTWTFDLDNDFLLSHWDGQGYDPYGSQIIINPEDLIKSAFIEVSFFDEDNYVDPYINTNGKERAIYTETANIFADGLNLITNINGYVEVDSQYIYRNIQANFLTDHLLEVTINCLSGDFEVYNVLLGGGFKDMPPANNPVPEPTTLLLFATGLAGLTAVSRKKTGRLPQD